MTMRAVPQPKGRACAERRKETLRYMQDVCKPFGTEMDIENGIATARL